MGAYDERTMLSLASQDPLAIKPKMSLAEILGLMQAADEGMVLLSLEEMGELADKLEDKVDGYKEYIDKCEAEVERLDKRVKMFAKTKSAIAKKVENLHKLLAFHMAKNSFKFMRGHDWKVVLTHSNSVEVKPDPTPDLYLEYPNFIRMKYEWNKVALSAALKAGDEKAAQIAERVEKINCKFDVNRGGADDN